MSYTDQSQKGRERPLHWGGASQLAPMVPWLLVQLDGEAGGCWLWTVNAACLDPSILECSTEDPLPGLHDVV